MYGEIAQIIEECMTKQSQLESRNSDSTDEAAHQSAEALGRVTAYNIDDPEGNIYRFGYGIGKWVYLTDAFDNIEKDLKDESYNVFAGKYNLTKESYTDEIKADITATINMSSVIFIDAYEKIVGQNAEIPICVQQLEKETSPHFLAVRLYEEETGIKIKPKTMKARYTAFL